MMTEMLKQLTLSVFGLVLGVAVLAANSNPAVADRGTRVIDGTPHYGKDATVTKRKAGKAEPPKTKRKFEDTLDFETEAVWRNLRPNRFSD